VRLDASCVYAADNRIGVGARVRGKGVYGASYKRRIKNDNNGCIGGHGELV